MYIPACFKNNDLNEVRDFLNKSSFGILVSQQDSKFLATHIPLELDKDENGKDILVGHISKGNPQWKNFTNDSQILAIFSGAHSYISSSWYDHENVPTWNYIAVHIYGKIKIIEGEKLINALKKLVDKYEANSDKPVAVEKMSEKFISKEIKGIVGFEIEINEIQSAYKLSQNRDARNHKNIISELDKKGDCNSRIIADEMKKHKKQ
ncbi:MAG: FMN-binding negative transcriptional regulator [Bacteroidia bacterium]|nr:FMN-binding negative transcriptional regulator [Bacteroidia bacterium]